LGRGEGCLQNQQIPDGSFPGCSERYAVSKVTTVTITLAGKRNCERIAAMRRSVVHLIFAMCLAACGGGSQSIPPPAAKAAPGTAAFMGDSITASWDLAAFDHSPTLNFGVSGDNTSQMLARFHNQVIDSDPAVVVILGGVNDFQEQGAAGTNTDAIQAMASEAQNAGIKVILCSVLPTDYPNPNLNLSEIQAFNQHLIQIAQENGYLYADYYDVMVNADGTTDDSLLADHIHPNDLGYARMWTVLSPLLAQDLQ
jgi:lysophospholipase L1-like esterase